MLDALESTGADYRASGGRVLFIEVYGRCATPGGYHAGDRLCYHAALVDAGRPPAHATGVEEAALLARTLEYPERLDVAGRPRLGTPHARTVLLDGPARAVGAEGDAHLLPGVRGVRIETLCQPGTPPPTRLWGQA